RLRNLTFERDGAPIDGESDVVKNTVIGSGNELVTHFLNQMRLLSRAVYVRIQMAFLLRVHRGRQQKGTCEHGISESVHGETLLRRLNAIRTPKIFHA